MKRTAILTVTALVLWGSSAPCFGAGFAQVGSMGFVWEGMFLGPRLAGTGGAAIADDPGAGGLLVNCAPLPRGNGAEAGFARANYFIDEIHFRTLWAAVERDGWRLDLADQAFIADDLLYRTAYLPEGTGEVMDLADRMTIIGVSREIGRLLLPWPQIEWTVGAALRFNAPDLTDESATTVDVGTSVRWRQDLGPAWGSLAATIMRQNLGDTSLELGERDADLPSFLRTGGTVAAGLPLPSLGRDLLGASFSYARTRPHWDYGEPVLHRGLELTLLEILSYRLGRNERFQDEETSWGLGLRLDRPFAWPVRIAADYAEMAMDRLDVRPVFTMEMWSLQAAVDF